MTPNRFFPPQGGITRGRRLPVVAICTQAAVFLVTCAARSELPQNAVATLSAAQPKAAITPPSSKPGGDYVGMDTCITCYNRVYPVNFT